MATLNDLGNKIISSRYNDSLFVKWRQGALGNVYAWFNFFTRQWATTNCDFYQYDIDADNLIYLEGPLGYINAALLCHSNGLCYFTTYGDPAGVKFYSFDVAVPAITYIATLTDNNTGRRIVEGSDGKIYIGQGVNGHLQCYDPVTEAWINFGEIDPTATTDSKYVWSIQVDATAGYIYCTINDHGKFNGAQYYLVCKSLTGPGYVETLYWETDAALTGNCAVYKGTDGNYYAYRSPATGGFNWFLLDGANAPVGCAAPDVYTEGTITADNDAPAGYSIDATYLELNVDGDATLQYKKPATGGTWQTKLLSPKVNTGPYPIVRIGQKPDGDLYLIPQQYQPFHTYNIAGDAVTWLGYPEESVYGVCYQPNLAEWFFGAYTNDLVRYDPAAAWTLNAGSSPETSSVYNPYHITFAGMPQYPTHVVIGVNNYLYIAGHTSATCALCYVNPDDDSGALIESFSGFTSCNLIALGGNRRLVLALNGDTGTDGKLVVYRSQDQRKIREITPFPGEENVGVVINVAENYTDAIAQGVAFGDVMIVAHPVSGSDSKAMLVNIFSGAVKWTQTYVNLIAYAGHGSTHRQLLRGPDGHVWLYMTNPGGEIFIYSIDPADGTATQRYQDINKRWLFWDGSTLFAHAVNDDTDCKLYTLTGY